MGSGLGGAVSARAGIFFGSFGRNALEKAVMSTLPSLAPSLGLGLIGTAVGETICF